MLLLCNSQHGQKGMCTAFNLSEKTQKGGFKVDGFAAAEFQLGPLSLFPLFSSMLTSFHFVDSSFHLQGTGGEPGNMENI